MADLSTQAPMGMKETEGIGLAQVTFRVRCEKIGHGESVFLSQADNTATGTRVREGQQSWHRSHLDILSVSTGRC